MERTRFGLSVTTGLILLLAGASFAVATPHPPDVNPANFVRGAVIDNQFFPLPVGRLFVYEGTKEGVATRDELCVTHRTNKVIEGVQITEVHHRSFELSDGKYVLVEDTFDWHAQDVYSNVWYFGEATTEFPSLSTEGSWEAGVDDADAGLIMEAAPRVGDRYYQEFAPKVAEDQAKVISLKGSACVRYKGGTCYEDLLVTQETSRLDPGVVEIKYYAAGVGFIRSDVVKGGDEHTELVSIDSCSE